MVDKKKTFPMSEKPNKTTCMNIANKNGKLYIQIIIATLL